MSQGLQLGQSQRLAQMQVLSPQMQQSLAILQAPVLELKALVDQELEQNPVLEEIPSAEAAPEQQEVKPDGEREEPASLADPAEPPPDTQFDPAQEKPSNEPVDDFQAEFDKLAQLDQEWREHFSETNLPTRRTVEDEERRQFMFDSLVAESSLQEVLLEQVRTSDLSADQQRIAEMIVGNIDDHGYLQSGVEELAFSTGIPAGQILTVLQVIQGFQPPGVGARDLRECLLLQLERAGKMDSQEYRVVRDHMEALGRRRFPEIARALGVEAEDAQAIAERISHLDPRPGRAFLPESAGQYIVPEVFVQKVGEEYAVTTNNDQIPHLRISNTYKDLMADAGSSPEVRQYIRTKIQAGKFLIKSLHQRQQTILNIAREIVARQREFMEKGVSGLKPLTMAAVAELVGVHETTVSRAVSGKYMETPQGVFEMRYFFTSGFTTAAGETVSNTSIKETLAAIIKEEDPSSPLSDETIVKMLTEKGIPIARRTVAKYRAELNILPSNLRRVY